MEVNCDTVRRSQLEIHSNTSSNISGDLRDDLLGRPTCENSRDPNSTRRGGCNNIKQILSRFCPTRDKSRDNSPSSKDRRSKSVSIAKNPDCNEQCCVKTRNYRNETAKTRCDNPTCPEADQSGARRTSPRNTNARQNSPTRRDNENRRCFSKTNVNKNRDMPPKEGRSCCLRSKTTPRFADADTQTSPIQTVARATDPVWDQWRTVSCCASSSPRSDMNDHFIDNFTQTIAANTYNCKNTAELHLQCPHCCNCCCNCTERNETDVDDFYELPYQNNEEYMELLIELEKKLNARNRARVRRTIRQFELRSRQSPSTPFCDCCCSCSDNDDRSDGDDEKIDKTDNDNDKDDDDDDDVDDESLLKKLERRLKARNRDRDETRQLPPPPRSNQLSPNRNSDILQNEKYWNQMEEKSKINRKNRNQWQYNAKSGDWYQEKPNRKAKSESPRSNPKSFRSCCCNVDCKKCCYQNKRNSQ